MVERITFEEQKMKVYVAIVEDRHTDTDIQVFRDKEKAIEWAKRQAKANGRGSKLEETDVPDWVYSAFYGTGGDSVRVEEKEIII